MKTATMREVETWEQRRREQAAKIEARRRVERRCASARKFPLGYGPGGRVPAYVDAYISSLEASPLGEPVFSPGRGVRPSARVSPPSPEGRRHMCMGTASTALGHQAHWAVAGEEDGCLRSRPNTAAKRCSVKVGQLVGSASPSVFEVRKSVFSCDRNASLLPRPATAPSESRPSMAPSALRRSRHAPSTHGHSRGLSASMKGEAQLMEKLTSLSGARPASEYPTVAALKTAVAIVAVQAQLREYRCGKGAGGSSQRFSSGIASNIINRQVGDTKRMSELRKTKDNSGRRYNIEPWDNRSPFIPGDKPTTVKKDKTNDEPDKVFALRATPLTTLTCNDPVFGSANVYYGRRSPQPTSPHLANPEIPTMEKYDITILSDRHPSGGISYAPADATAAAAAKDEMEACFRRLKLVALVELGHLRNPPKPVQAVLAALACLLGWRLKPLGKLPPRSLFSNAHALRDILASIHPHQISSRRLSALVKRLTVKEAGPKRVKEANAAAALLLEWLLAVVTLARAGEICL